MVLQYKTNVDKYLNVVAGFLFVGMVIAWISPTTGEVRDPPLYLMFWASIGGLVAVFLYGSYKTRKERELERYRRKKSRKK